MPKIIERTSGIEEWICEHGIGHPTRESAERVAKKHGHPIDIWLQHCCDGCCKNNDQFK